MVAANLATYGHPTSTVPMGGATDPVAVIDSVGAVRGLQNLRVTPPVWLRRRDHTLNPNSRSRQARLPVMTVSVRP